MQAEFRAVGVPYAKRGAITDATLAFLERCFAADEVEANGQRFLFLPRPPRPPLFIGGAPPHGFRRAVRHEGGWMPIGVEPEPLAPLVGELRALAAQARKPPPEVAVITTLPLDDPPRAAARARAFADAGATRLVHGWRYPDAATFARVAETLAAHVRSAVSG
jgi:alkanesulfonate monooxygenase SsuD/methylene tetrahydromethanopterin reductase-like flavin-dependent oxidoreductase (luciferase family)